MNAQIASDKVTGEYYLQGVMETATGIKLNPDSTFEFFFSQGALDRFGKGKWNMVDGKIVLNSREKPEVDFAMVTSKKIKGDNIIIKLTGVNQHLMQYLEAKVVTSKGEAYSETGKDGIMELETNGEVEEITLHFLICGERVSVYKPAHKSHNYYEFKPEAWIDEVFCENIMLRMDGNKLIGSHPLLQGNAYRYEKAK